MTRRNRALCLLSALPLYAQEPIAAASAFVREHCVACHGGDVVKGGLDLTRDEVDVPAQLWRWHRLAERVRNGEMPPADADAPPAAARAAFAAAIAAHLGREVPRLPPDGGRVTVRRLSRSQWANVMRDTFGVEIATTSFPADDLGYGFDTIGDALSFSTLHLEHHLAAAALVAAAVFSDEDPARPVVRRHEGEAMQVADGTVRQDGDSAHLLTRATLTQDVDLPRDGIYRLRLVLGADQAGDEPAQVAIALDGRQLDEIEVAHRALQPIEWRLPVAGGRRRVAITFRNDFYAPEHPDPARRDRNLRVDALEWIGPLDVRPVPAEQRWLHEALANGADGDPARLDALVAALLPRLWRREPTAAERERLVAAGRQQLHDGASLAAVRGFVLQAALVSPHFLFRVETAPGSAPTGAELATRLSFFLWGSGPDDALRADGATGRLARRDGLHAAVDRMLVDPRAERLATEFAASWLELRSLADRTPDPARFPGFDDALKASLRRETELLFLAVLREDRDVRELLTADFTHVDARLAAHYGLSGPAVDAGFVRVALPPGPASRGGLLGHGSILAVTSNPTRTSPVKRGKWILENLLGQAPPAPPPGNDSLAGEARIDSSRSFREQLAAHRERPACAVCHVRMDALGFALEHFDAVGRHHTVDAGGAIDASGQLPDGTRLDGLASLRAALAADPAFPRTLAEKLFVHAVGRDLRPIDRLRLHEAVARRCDRGRVTVRDLVHVVAADVAFAGPVPTGR